MSQAAASIHVIATHAATAARAAAKADSSAASASEGVDFSALLAGQLGTSVEGLKALDSSVVPEDEPGLQPDATDGEGADASAQADALAALGIPAIHPNAQAAITPQSKAGRDEKQAEADVGIGAEPSNIVPAPAAVLAESKQSLPADLAAAAEVGARTGDPAPETRVADPATTTFVIPGNQTTPSASAVAAPSIHGPEQPIAVGRGNFADEVGNRLTWMASNGKQQAEIRLDPPHLGPLELRLSITGDQASLSVVSAHQAVRDAVQNSVSRLQDMMQAVGVNLGQVFVGQGSQDQQSRGEFANRPNGSMAARDEDDDGAIPVAAPANVSMRRGSGLVDVFA